MMTIPRSNMTMRDVARVAGVSHATVSRVIHDSERISKKTKDHVRKVIAELGYTPNSVAQKLARIPRRKQAESTHEGADAYGQAMHDYFHGNYVQVVVERDDGYISCHSPSICFTERDEWSAHEKKALWHAKGNILDVGCGAGRHALYLQQDENIDVLAIDKSAHAVKICTSRGVHDVRRMGLSDIGDLDTRFDTVLLLGCNFSLLGSPQKAQSWLTGLHEHTTDDAVILAECTNPYRTREEAHVAYHRKNQKQGRKPGELRLRVRYGQHTSEWFRYLLLSPAEMAELVYETGWSIKQVIDDPTQRSYAVVLEKCKR